MAVERRILSTTRPEPLAELGRAGRPDLYPSDHASDWYVVQVKPRYEGRVQRRLALSTLPTFLPFIEISRRRGSVRAHSLEPLFPRYLFVRLASMHVDPRSWNVVRWTPGVVSILAVGDTPVSVPDPFVAAIEERISEHGFVRQPSSLVNGSKVRICSGPFEDLEAVFDRPASRSGRVRVLLQLLGQPTPVEIDEDELDPA